MRQRDDLLRVAKLVQAAFVHLRPFELGDEIKNALAEVDAVIERCEPGTKKST
jgi:hypothetical protein